jgi:hypothetical protein
MRAILSLALAALTLVAIGGCDRGKNSSADAGLAESEADAGERLAALPEGQRNAVFIRAIRDAGMDCQGVDRSSRAGDYRDIPVWTATCTNGADYTIVVPRTGVAQVLNAEELKLVER